MKATASAESSPSWLAQKVGAWNTFWFHRTDAFGLGILRLLLGVILVLWLFSFRHDLDSLFGAEGWVTPQARELLATQDEGRDLPVSTWSPVSFFKASAALHSFYWFGMITAGLFAIGVASRWTGLISWFVVATFTSNSFILVEGDVLLGIATMYIAAAYLFMGWSKLTPSLTWIVGDGHSLISAPLGGRRASAHSVSANFWLRVLQIHFAFFIGFLGMQKLRVAEWWSGDGLWFPLHPTFKTTFDSIMEERAIRDPGFTKFAISAASYAVIFWQLSFPFLIWRGGWRRFYQWTSLLGSAFVFGVYHDPAFAGLLFVGALAFTPEASWRRIATRVFGFAYESESARDTEGLAEEKRNHGKTAERMVAAAGRVS